MAKFYGKVGYAQAVETAPGVYKNNAITERHYRGDVIKSNRRLENSENLNDNIRVNNSISIVADAYAYEHFFAMKYVEWMGSLWKISNAEVQRPRIILTLGEVYNGPKPKI